MKLSSVVKISAVAFPAVSAFNHQAAKKTATSLDQGASAPTRRVFLTQATTSTGLVGSAAAVGWFTNVENGSHGAGCACDSCAGMAPGHSSSCTCSACASNSDHGPVGKYEPGHGPGCSCGICVKLGPNIASAYDRDVGGKSQSADTFAQNIQARETNARLEASGFKLDSKEEEAARLSEGLSSFSYESSTSEGKKGARGYSTPPAKQKK